MMITEHGGISAEDRTDLVALPVLWWGAASKRDASHCWGGWGQSISLSGLRYQTVLEFWNANASTCWVIRGNFKKLFVGVKPPH